jgi:hypothetical protein
MSMPLQLSTMLEELKTQTTEACATIGQDVLWKVWQEVEYRFDIAEATRGAHIDLYWFS